MSDRKQEVFHIGLACPDYFPDPIISQFMEDLEEESLQIRIDKMPPVAYAAFEWITPTLIAAFVIKPYFEEFLKEAGKDHYHKLSAWLKKLTGEVRDIPVKTVTASDAIHKADNSYSQSKVISLYVQTQSGKLLKLLFDEQLDQKDWENAIDALLEYAVEHYEKSPEDKLTAQISEFEQENRSQLYVVIDKQTKKLEFLDDKKFLQRTRENR